MGACLGVVNVCVNPRFHYIDVEGNMTLTWKLLTPTFDNL